MQGKSIEKLKKGPRIKRGMKQGQSVRGRAGLQFVKPSAILTISNGGSRIVLMLKMKTTSFDTRGK